MRIILTLVAVLYSVAALAQTDKPPMVGDQPLVQVRPAKGKKAAVAPIAKPDASALLACLDIDDGTKERLNCFDALIPPAPKPKASKAKSVSDCRFTKEEDERLACFNGFVEKNAPKPQPPKT